MILGKYEINCEPYLHPAILHRRPENVMKVRDLRLGKDLGKAKNILTQALCKGGEALYHIRFYKMGRPSTNVWYSVMLCVSFQLCPNWANIVFVILLADKRQGTDESVFKKAGNKQKEQKQASVLSQQSASVQQAH